METQLSNKEVIHALSELSSDAPTDVLLPAIRRNLFKGDHRTIADSLGLKSISCISDVLLGKRKSQRVINAALKVALQNRRTLAEMGRTLEG